MGVIITAKCGQCGFSREGIFYGQGMAFEPPKIPAIRKDSGELVVAELAEDVNLRFYHEREMYKDPINKDFQHADYGIQNVDIWLNRKGNICPSCQQFTMEFIEVGNWD